MRSPSKKPARKRVWIFGITVFLVILLLWFATDTRSVDLREFDPAAVAKNETAAWRAYYSDEWGALFREVFEFATQQYGFSFRDSVLLGGHAANAALIFRTETGPSRVPKAMLAMRPYFQIFSERSGHPFNFYKVSELEVEWWQLRRDQAPPERWAQTIAEQAALIFHCAPDLFLPAARLRVEAMVFRDSHRDSYMTETDWAHVQTLLTESAQLFWNALHEPNQKANRLTTVGP